MQLKQFKDLALCQFVVLLNTHISFKKENTLVACGIAMHVPFLQRSSCKLMIEIGLCQFKEKLKWHLYNFFYPPSPSFIQVSQFYKSLYIVSERKIQHDVYQARVPIQYAKKKKNHLAFSIAVPLNRSCVADQAKTPVLHISQHLKLASSVYVNNFK